MKGEPRNILTWPIGHPRVTFLIALLCAAIAAMGVSRIHADTSLDALFARDSQAGRALTRVMRDFGAVDDLIVLASAPDARGGAELDRLVAFAERFDKRVAQSTELSALSDGVIYRADAQTREFFEKVLAPSAVFYLDDAAFAAAQQRLTREGMRQQIERDQAMLATPGPAAGALAKAFMQDPLRLHEFLLDRLKSQNPIRTWRGGDAFISEDGRSLLIRVRGKRPPSDIEFCKTFTSAISAAAREVNSDGFRLEFAGSYAIAAESARAIRSDMIGSVIGSVVFLQLLFLMVYRGAFRLFAVALGPIALGVLLGFGAYSLGARALTPMSAVLGGILAGMAIDYSIQYLSAYESRRATGAAPREAAIGAVNSITSAAFGAWTTSVIGFLAIGASSVRMLREFSVLGAIGLAGAFVAVVGLVPVLLMGVDEQKLGSVQASRRFFRFTLDPYLGWLARHYCIAMLASAVLLLGAAAVLLGSPGYVLPLESDLTVMHPRPNPALDAQQHLAEQFGVAPDSIIVHLQAGSPRELVALAHEVDRRLKSNAGREAGVTATYGLATLLPDPQIVPARLREIGLAEADRVVADFRAAMTDAGFNVDATPIENYAKFLRLLLTRTDAPSVADLLPYRRLAETMLPRSAFQTGSAAEAITLVFVRESFNSRSARDQAVEGVRKALAGLSGATPTGLSVVGYDTERTVARDLPRLIWVAVIAVAVYLLLHFQRITDAALALAPTAFSLVVLLAAMRLMGQKLNMVNLVALPLLVGIDVDYGIFLVSLARVRQIRTETREELIRRLAPVCHAVLVCGIATMIGFGSLVTTRVPAVRSLGFCVVVGIAACLWSTFFAVTPIFLRMAGGEVGQKGVASSEEAQNSR